jgi:hypothetical protein
MGQDIFACLLARVSRRAGLGTALPTTRRSFGDALYGALLESVSQTVQARGPETVKRRRGIIEWARVWRAGAPD